MGTRHNISKRPHGVFDVTLYEAEVGDEIVYHVGAYAGGPHKKEAYESQLTGKCFLYQIRLAKELFEYVAKKKV